MEGCPFLPKYPPKMGPKDRWDPRGEDVITPVKRKRQQPASKTRAPPFISSWFNRTFHQHLRASPNTTPWRTEGMQLPNGSIYGCRGSCRNKTVENPLPVKPLSLRVKHHVPPALEARAAFQVPHPPPAATTATPHPSIRGGIWVLIPVNL